MGNQRSQGNSGVPGRPDNIYQDHQEYFLKMQIPGFIPALLNQNGSKWPSFPTSEAKGNSNFTHFAGESKANPQVFTSCSLISLFHFWPWEKTASFSDSFTRPFPHCFDLAENKHYCVATMTCGSHDGVCCAACISGRARWVPSPFFLPSLRNTSDPGLPQGSRT